MRSMTTKTRKRASLAGAIAVLGILLLTASSCSGDPTAQEKEDTSRQSNYEKLVDSQPAESMDFSPTRETKNFWIETWDEPGKLSYVYLMNSGGDLIGYYVFEGLPVSYCVSLIPPYKILNEGLDSQIAVPAPSIDGTFSSGGDCNTKYGKDATTGSYMEFTVGANGLTMLLYELPLARQDILPLGITTIEDVKG